MRKLFGNIRLKLKNIFELIDNGKEGYLTDDEMFDYL